MADTSSIVPGKCLICSTPNTSIHFGIDACRACTSFFKRAKLSGHRFPCRRGDKKCDVRRESGLLCRGCRYEKSTSLGMIYDGPMRKDKRSLSKTNDDSTPSTSIAEETLLERIGREHAACIGRRREQEMELIRTHRLDRVPHPTEEIYQVNFNCALETFKVSILESWQFFLAVFPSIGQLPFEDQREFFRLCLPQFAMIDCFYRTMRIWGGLHKYSMCSVLTCSDIANPEVWIGPQDGGSMREELLELIRAYIDDQMRVMRPSFEQADISETEKHALLALLLCESELRSDLAERFQSFLEDIRAQTLQDLHRFYTEKMGLSEYSTRLGRLFTICLTFREGNVLFREFFRMQVTIFDVFVAETLLQELLL